MSCVLVVEDNVPFCKTVAAMLANRGYDTRTAADGRRALDEVARQRPDLILLDIAMPVMDGRTFLRHLRADERWRDIPVIVMTAMSDRDLASADASLPAQASLTKSRFSMADLLQTIARCLPPRPPAAASQKA
jgi:CheY-like chemotaxis protein